MPNVGERKSWWRRLWTPSARYSAGFLLIVGFLGGAMSLGGFGTALELTNTESFCLSCHEMKNNVYREYQSTVHYTNRTGVRAVCTDCHVPKDWYHKIIRKVQASNELLHHFLGSVSTREQFVGNRLQLAENVWRTMKSTDSRECRNCHSLRNMDLSAQERRSAEQHQQSLADGGSCIDCHAGIAHRLPPGAEQTLDRIKRELSPPAKETLARAP